MLGFINFRLHVEGRSNRSVNYKLRGSEVDKVFNAFGAIAATVLCNNPGLLPELQVLELSKTCSLLITSIKYTINISAVNHHLLISYF